MEGLKNYDLWKLNSAHFFNGEVVDRCEHCGKLIYEGDEVIKVHGSYLCDDECLFQGLGAERVYAK